MDTVLPDGWNEFAVAAAGATAALAGLLVVAISLNVKEILAERTLVTRAGATIAALVLAVVISLAFLVPGQTLLALGIEIAVATVLAGYFELVSVIADFRQSPERPIGEALIKLPVSAGELVPPLVGSILFIAGQPAGAYAVALGVALIVVGSMINAWVLLIEILR